MLKDYYVIKEVHFKITDLIKKSPQVLTLKKNKMEALIIEAKAKRLWFNSMYQNLWFSPYELEELRSQGKFLWGPANWTLRDPKERIYELTIKIEKAQKELSDFIEKVKIS